MDARIRKLEHQVVTDPSLRGALLAEYVRTGEVSPQVVNICARLGHLEAMDYSNLASDTLSNCLLLGLPKKVYLALGLGAVLELKSRFESIIDQDIEIHPEVVEDIRHGMEELQQLIASCRIFQDVSVPAILNKQDKEETVNVPGYRLPLALLEHALVIRRKCEDYARRSRFGLGIATRIEIPRYLTSYFEAHLALARAINKKPGQRAKECVSFAITCCVHGDEPELWLNASETLKKEQIFTPIIEDAAKRHVYLVLLGPYLV